MSVQCQYNIGMLIQKLYKNGNSVAVTIPKEYLKEFNLREGTEVVVEQDAATRTITISPNIDHQAYSTVTPKFLKWLEAFNKEYGPALKELAKR